ncbi:hypothetical protein RB195_019825 [Necator americanus]|uniref:C2H2-type domain-containing protein n=1 Tax=Necator americanus TaxID=51031 RepID=A0ABR1CHJ5_NECAM
MNLLQKGNYILPKLFDPDKVFFRTTTIEKILPPCAPENSVELCFYCIEGHECVDHPNRRKMRSGIDCFADDDFRLVDEHHIKNLHKSPDEEEIDTKECILANDDKEVEVKREASIDCGHHLTVVTATKGKAMSSRRPTKSGDHCHQEVMTVSEIPRKRFSRFREKTFVCDVCDAAFTLKQNVQSHLFIYHMQKDGSLKQHTRLMYKCDNCEKQMKDLRFFGTKKTRYVMNNG